jgi:hypothetical protein
MYPLIRVRIEWEQRLVIILVEKVCFVGVGGVEGRGVGKPHLSNSEFPLYAVPGEERVEDQLKLEVG